MCGVAGILTYRAELDLEKPLQGMLAALRHRGPDDEGTVQVTLPRGGRLGLAQTRLAIIDLSPGGHQPMTDADSGSWIVYNGETYNHDSLRQRLPDVAFRSTSDTETILRGWARLGEPVLHSLRGMFAFALYDARRQQFWLVRDRLGIKPLYVSRLGDDTWFFASEVRALLASGLVERHLNPDAVSSYLAFGAVTAPWTLLQGVESLLPGECWRFEVGENGPPTHPERNRYWQPPVPGGVSVPTREDAVHQLRPVLLDAVSLRMRADVPVGVFLSGGIDSSAVVAALAACGHRLRSFSVVFGERQFDESMHSRQIAQHFGTEHTELLLHPEQVLEDLDEALAAYDQPSIDGVNTYFISRATRQAGVKVALSGIGGDELFAGYPYFRWLAQLERPGARRFAQLAHWLLRRLAPESTRTTKLGALLQQRGSRLARYAVCRQVMAADRREALLGDNGALLMALPDELREQLEKEVTGLDAVNAHSRLELGLYLANMLLRDLDQMSMAHALEVREPLLDHVLVETVAQLPGAWKLDPGRQRSNKGLLVDALPEGLPDRVLHRKKMGFVFPWERWLRRELKNFVAGVFVDIETLEAVGLDHIAVQRLWQDFLAARPGVRYTDILCLLHLLRWVRRHRLEARQMAQDCYR